MPILRFFTVGALILATVLPVPALAQALKAEVRFEGISDEIIAEVRAFSSIAREPSKYSALAPIGRAAEADARVLRGALQSEGYFAARVTAATAREGDKARVTFTVEPGPLFTLTGVRITYIDDIETERPGSLEGFGIPPLGTPTGAAIKEAGQALQVALWDRGHIGAEVVDHTVEADFSEGTAEVIYRARTGPIGHFGTITVDGNTRTDPDYIRQYRTFEEGDLAQRDLLTKYRSDLSRTGLFTEVDLQPRLPDATGRTDIVARVDERPHRTIGGGVSFATDIGPGAEVFWENRNLFRRGETLRTEVIASAPLQEAGLTFRKERPRFPGYYTLGGVVRNEDTDAFNAQTIETGAGLGKYFLDRKLTVEGGVRYQYSNIRSRDSIDRGIITERDRIFRAVSFPLSVQWNSQEAPLDPQQGFLAGATIAPYLGTVNFNRVEIHGTDRIFWGPKDGGTLAGRIKLGATYGASRNDLPPTERFFAGGGGSIRGFAFQEASPIDEVTSDILGGASLAEINLEVRQHVTKDIELAVFSDFGGAFESNTPDFENVLVAAGFGVRYHTPIGPFRVDVAFPIDRRQFFGPDTDDDGEPNPIFQDTAFQLYIALGQPF